MAAPSVDTRKLKDSVAEFLRKNKFEKASETLEQLVKAEPKDMTHRLKLGDAYRKLEHVEKAINCYHGAAKFFSDEGQLIKAIGAIKVILEIDPKNETAQRELAAMNGRRFAKPTMESAGLQAPRGVGAGARATSALELDEGERAAAAIANMFEEGKLSPDPASGDDEALELDDGKPARPRQKGVAPGPPPRTAAPPRPPGPPPKQRPAYDLGGDSDALELDDGLPPAPRKPPPLANPPPPAVAAPRPPPPRGAGRMDEGPLELDPEELEELPADAIQPLEPAAQASASDELELDLDAALPARAAAKPAAPPRPQAPVRTGSPVQTPRSEPPRASPPAAQVGEVLEIELPRAAPRGAPAPARAFAAGEAHPIADLLNSEAEEEIELLSLSSDDEVRGQPLATPQIAASGDDLDAAFGAIAPSATSRPPRPPPRVPLFDDLPQAAFVELVNRLSFRRYSPPELILREGEPGRSFFVIVEGKVRVFKSQPGGSELNLAHLGEGAFFGEMALLSGAPRTANVAAEEDTELLEVTDQVLREVVEKFPQVGAALKNFYRQRLLNNVMAISPLFKDFDPGERKSIVERFRMRQVAQGEVLITQGKPSDGLYVVLHGAVKVEAKAGSEKSVQLAQLKEGDLFGEMSLLTRKPATATVSAAVNAIVLKLPRQNFQELVLTHPQILELVSALTEQRRSATEAILSGQGPGIDGMAFV